jgi:hypothetical protein
MLVGTRVGIGVESTIAASFVVYKGVPSTARTVNQATHVSMKPDSEESSGISTQSNSWPNASASCDAFCKSPCDGACKYLDPVTSTSATLVLLSKNSGSVFQQPAQ